MTHPWGLPKLKSTTIISTPAGGQFSFKNDLNIVSSQDIIQKNIDSANIEESILYDQEEKVEVKEDVDKQLEGEDTSLTNNLSNQLNIILCPT